MCFLSKASISNYSKKKLFFSSIINELNLQIKIAKYKYKKSYFPVVDLKYKYKQLYFPVVVYVHIDHIIFKFIKYFLLQYIPCFFTQILAPEYCI